MTRTSAVHPWRPRHRTRSATESCSGSGVRAWTCPPSCACRSFRQQRRRRRYRTWDARHLQPARAGPRHPRRLCGGCRDCRGRLGPCRPGWRASGPRPAAPAAVGRWRRFHPWLPSGRHGPVRADGRATPRVVRHPCPRLPAAHGVGSRRALRRRNRWRQRHPLREWPGRLAHTGAARPGRQHAWRRRRLPRRTARRDRPGLRPADLHGLRQHRRALSCRGLDGRSGIPRHDEVMALLPSLHPVPLELA